VIKEGGRIEKDEQAGDVFVIPVQEPKPTPLEQSWEPGPIANSKFTKAEMAKMVIPEPEKDEKEAKPVDIQEAIVQFAPGWIAKLCGNEMNPGLRDTLRGKENVLVTHPLSQKQPCLMYKFMDIPKDKTTKLRLVVGHHELGDWVLAVGIDKDTLFEKTIGKESTKDGWVDFEVDLSSYAGKKKAVVLYNKANDWAYEAAYWADISIVSE
jgi:hypothetical protein